jgi:hypothetical protein
MEAESSFERPVNLYEITGRHIREDILSHVLGIVRVCLWVSFTRRGSVPYYIYMLNSLPFKSS